MNRTKKATSDDRGEEERPEAGLRSNFLSIRILYALAIGGGLIITGMIDPRYALAGRDATIPALPYAVPTPIYLYAYLGVVAYSLITFAENWKPDVSSIAGILLRIPAALLVAIGIYLLGTIIELNDVMSLILDSEGRYELGFSAFLVGLFIERALGSLRVASARLYPGNPSELYP